MNARIEDDVRQWKAIRGILQGWIPASEDDFADLQARAQEATAVGKAWLIWGFDPGQPSAAVAELASAGLRVDEATFRSMAHELPGPYEVAEAWRDVLGGVTGADWARLWLAARALWAAWLPDVPTLETEADRVESAMRNWYLRGDIASAFEGLDHLASVLDGSEAAFDAIDEELPRGLHAFILKVFEGAADVADIDRCVAIADALAQSFHYHGVLQARVAQFVARHGRHEDARERLAPLLMELDEDDEPSPSLMGAVADALSTLGDASRAIEVAERRVRVARNDEDDQDAARALLRMLEELGRSGDVAERLRLARLARSQDERQRRRQRRRADKSRSKKPGKRRR